MSKSDLLQLLGVVFDQYPTNEWERGEQELRSKRGMKKMRVRETTVCSDSKNNNNIRKDVFMVMLAIGECAILPDMVILRHSLFYSLSEQYSVSEQSTGYHTIPTR